MKGSYPVTPQPASRVNQELAAARFPFLDHATEPDDVQPQRLVADSPSGTPEADLRQFDSAGPAMDFEWDEAKAEANERKHGVSFAEAMTVLADPLSLTGYDPDHSGDYEDGNFP